eukprot:Platyproteum_vivax@DN13764_c0_g1_i1.p1
MNWEVSILSLSESIPNCVDLSVSLEDNIQLHKSLVSVQDAKTSAFLAIALCEYHQKVLETLYRDAFTVPEIRVLSKDNSTEKFRRLMLEYSKIFISLLQNDLASEKTQPYDNI